MRRWRAFLGGVIAAALLVVADAGPQTAVAQERNVRVEFGRGQSSTSSGHGPRYEGQITGSTSGRPASRRHDGQLQRQQLLQHPRPGGATRCSTARSRAISPTSSFPTAATMSSGLPDAQCRAPQRAGAVYAQDRSDGRQPVAPAPTDFADGLSGGPDFFQWPASHRAMPSTSERGPRRRADSSPGCVNGEILRKRRMPQ